MGAYMQAAGMVMGVLGNSVAGDAQQASAYGQAAAVQRDAYSHAIAIRKAASAVRGSARTGFASSGVKVDAGSAATVDTAIAKNSELDALTAIASGTESGNALRASGDAAALAGKFGAASSVLQGYGSNPTQFNQGVSNLKSKWIWGGSYGA